MAAPAETEASQASDPPSKMKKSKNQKKKHNQTEQRSTKASEADVTSAIQDFVQAADEDRSTPPSPSPNGNGRQKLDLRPKEASNGHLADTKSPSADITELQQEMEALKVKHSEELEAVNDKLEEAQNEKEHAESQYQSLLGKVGTIKAQLGERLKADAEEISQAKSQIEDLESQNQQHLDTVSDLRKKIAQMTEEDESRSKELSTLRNRTNLSQQNWIHEREELVNREAYVREEFEAARQAMQDWEVLAMEERSIRESLNEKVAELEEQVNNHREAFELASKERDSQSNTVDGLQRALQEIQSARKVELRELVESSQASEDKLKKRLQDSEADATEARSLLQTSQKELERALPFEKEVKEKNLLIGKLRHEAVILNDHLTKALRFLKKGKPEDNVDRQIVTNHFLQFLALDRADPKKFQVLQLIAALLNWSDEQREQAGLSRPGAPGGSLRVQLSSPFLRTPSSPALSSELSAETPNRESLAELWSNFLEQEAGSSKSRSESMSSMAKPS